MKAYVNIIFKIILAPLEIGLGAIPGMKIGFSSWINGLFANLMIFPISLLFMVLANIIIEETSGTSGLWAPSMVKYNAPGTVASLLTSVSGGLVPVAVGISSLMILGKLPELIPQVIFAIKPGGFESAIAQSGQNITAFPFKVVETAGAIPKAYQGFRETKNLAGKLGQWGSGIKAATTRPAAGTTSTPPAPTSPAPAPPPPKNRKGGPTPIPKTP